MPFMADRWEFFCRTVSLTANKAWEKNIFIEKQEISSLERQKKPD